MNRTCFTKLMFVFITIVFNQVGYSAPASSIQDAITKNCPTCVAQANNATASLILDKGETALLSRAWLTHNAQQSIDIQYFIWSNDNIGILAAEALLQAAERGVKVRVIVDDFLIDANMTSLLSLAKHPNIQIKIYNPLHKVGVSTLRRWLSFITEFRAANQRMHDKVAIYDGQIAITGGRNMADEYFDFNQDYSFRDRDILVYGQSVKTMSKSFASFWNHSLSSSIEKLLPKEYGQLSTAEINEVYQGLKDYANDPENFSLEVRGSIKYLSQRFQQALSELRWSQARFIHDVPGKNDGLSGLKGGGKTTQEIAKLLNSAQSEVLIQSPYLVMPEEGFTLLKELISRGIKIKISTNSLASTDNLLAYSGYSKIRNDLIKMGVEVFEYKPHPKNQAVLYQRYQQVKDSPPIFAIHAKSMVIDRATALIGTFNLDPRSIHLNTEVAMVVPNVDIATELSQLILDDMQPENSWQISKGTNPDKTVSLWKRMKLTMLTWLPLDPIL